MPLTFKPVGITTPIVHTHIQQIVADDYDIRPRLLRVVRRRKKKNDTPNGNLLALLQKDLNPDTATCTTTISILFHFFTFAFLFLLFFCCTAAHFPMSRYVVLVFLFLFFIYSSCSSQKGAPQSSNKATHKWCFLGGPYKIAKKGLTVPWKTLQGGQARRFLFILIFIHIIHMY